MSALLKIIICAFAFTRISVTGESIEDLKEKFAKSVMECSGGVTMTAADLQRLRTGQFPDTEPMKCLFACVYKKTGMVDDEGQLSEEGVRSASEKYLSNNPELMKKSEEFTKACIGVNDVAINDGIKSCERAALIYKCSVEKAPEFGLL